jgi:hypothetical protein
MPSENTIFEVCQYLKNWFDRNQEKYFGDITISNGALTTNYGLKPNQYFRIVGSTLNDGVYKYPLTTLTDETFNGAIWGMALPKAFLSLLDEIETWKIKYASADSVAMSPFTSESVPGVYSYSKSSGGNDTTTDKSGTWQGVFGARLAPYRKM